MLRLMLRRAAFEAEARGCAWIRNLRDLKLTARQREEGYTEHVGAVAHVWYCHQHVDG